jgi:DNA repair protein RecO (recombination protein O)
MLTKSQGIVVKSTRYSESSAIVKIYTRQYGMLSFLIPGAYSKKSQLKAALLQPLQILELDFYYTENKNLYKIKEAKTARVLNNIHFERNRSANALVVSELIHKCIQEEEQNVELFAFLIQCIELLDDEKRNISNFLLMYLLHFSKYIGFFPSDNYTPSNPYFDLYEGRFKSGSGINKYLIDEESSSILQKLLKLDLLVFDSLEISSSGRLKLIEHLVDYYKIHISNFQQLNSFEVIKALYVH